MSGSLLVVGSVALDSVEAPAGRRDDILGGSASFFTTAASYFVKPRLVAVVGDDFPPEHVSFLEGRGVDTAGLERVPGRTFRWAGRYSKDLNNRTTLDTQLNVFADFRPKIPAAFKGSPLVMLGNIHPALQLDVLKQVDRPQLVVADTMNFWIKGEPKALEELLPKIDLLVINDEEVRELAGVHNLRRAADEVRKRGPKSLIVKRGEHGALLFDAQGVFFVPAFPLEDVRDPTGAGDSFAGGLLGYLASHDHTQAHAMRRAMFFASAMGSFCVEDIGPKRLLSITRRDLRARLDQFRAMVEYGGDLPFRD